MVKASITPAAAPPIWNSELAPAAALAVNPEASSNSGIQLVSMNRLSRLAANISHSNGVIQTILPANRAAYPTGSAPVRTGRMNSSSSWAPEAGSICRAILAIRALEPPRSTRKAMDSGRPRPRSRARTRGARPPNRNS